MLTVQPSRSFSPSRLDIVSSDYKETVVRLSRRHQQGYSCTHCDCYCGQFILRTFRRLHWELNRHLTLHRPNLSTTDVNLRQRMWVKKWYRTTIKKHRDSPSLTILQQRVVCYWAELVQLKSTEGQHRRVVGGGRS